MVSKTFSQLSWGPSVRQFGLDALRVSWQSPRASPMDIRLPGHGLMSVATELRRQHTGGRKSVQSLKVKRWAPEVSKSSRELKYHTLLCGPTSGPATRLGIEKSWCLRYMAFGRLTDLFFPAGEEHFIYLACFISPLPSYPLPTCLPSTQSNA
jgi:hypothetical protein